MSCASVVLPTPGRPPENDRGQLVALDLLPQRLAGPEDVLLARVIVQRLGTHALGERPLRSLPRAGRLAERRGIEQAHTRTASRYRCRRAS